MENAIAFLFAILLVLFFSRGYIKRWRSHEERVREIVDEGHSAEKKPRAQHPHIDPLQCIGCATCTTVCPEGDVLGMLGGSAVIVHPDKCIGHAMCAEACPVGAITMVLGAASMGGDLPRLTSEYETSIPNLFIVGELGGLALIKNAVSQGRDTVDVIAARMAGRSRGDESVLDVIIVGAGPAGISASLRAIENKMSYLTIERDELGGTVAKYPRQKLVMTSPVEFPLYGRFNKIELSKEELLRFWDKVLHRADFRARTGESVSAVKRAADGTFTVVTNCAEYRSRAVVLALGRAGVPNKLGVAGEDLPKVMYRLIEADHYTNNAILVVGGGDSAVEAALGLARQDGNRVTLSYRKDSFSRIKDRNRKRLDEALHAGKLEVVLNSTPVEFRPDSVLLDVGGTVRELPNDYVWIFAGGTSPNAFLTEIGVELGSDVAMTV